MVALAAGLAAAGSLPAIAGYGVECDEQTSIGYTPDGTLWIDAPASTNLTSINIDSASGIFTGHEWAQNLDGSFDNHSEDNIFKATFGSSFGSLSFGMVAMIGLSEEFLLNDLTVVGSLDGGGDLGNVDLFYLPEPSSRLLALFGIIGLLHRHQW
jgi:hypothetical protein